MYILRQTNLKPPPKPSHSKTPCAPPRKSEPADRDYSTDKSWYSGEGVIVRGLISQTKDLCSLLDIRLRSQGRELAQLPKRTRLIAWARSYCKESDSNGWLFKGKDRWYQEIHHRDLSQNKYRYTQRKVWMDCILDQNGISVALSERHPFIWGLTNVSSKNKPHLPWNGLIIYWLQMFLWFHSFICTTWLTIFFSNTRR